MTPRGAGRAPRARSRARFDASRSLPLLVCALLLSPVVARAEPPKEPASQLDTAPNLAELTVLQAALASSDGETRKQAFDTLRSLADDALPAITRRLGDIQARGFDPAAVLSAMSELRRLQGVDAPDGEVDLAKGVLLLLARTRDAAAVLAAELTALLRALEAQKTAEAGELIVSKLFALDSKLFRYEAPRTRARLGVLLIPALIRHADSPTLLDPRLLQRVPGGDERRQARARCPARRRRAAGRDPDGLRTTRSISRRCRWWSRT